jgi:acyl-CoA thioester hydrolase
MCGGRVGAGSYSGLVTITRIEVRSYELDALGHVNQAVYHQYAELGRVAAVEAAGGRFEHLLANRLAPVLLEAHISFRRELRRRDVVEVSCETRFSTGKTFQTNQVISKLDGTVAAEITSTLGIMDLEARRLVADPRAAFESVGVDVRVLSGSE